MTDRNKLKENLNTCKKEIGELRQTLNQLDAEKEKWFKKKLNYEVPERSRTLISSKEN